jgi:ABC-2 type transport system ATP-binding protein
MLDHEKRIQAKDLHKSFGKTQAINNFNLQVSAGEIYGLVGPDGAGKTTAIRLLCGALKPDSGQVIIDGHDMAHAADSAREQIGYLSQKFSLYEELTVFENLRFFAKVRGLSSQEWEPRSLEILQFVGLDTFIHRHAGYLSGGMKQKLGLATALIHKPRVLLLDEPTGGVDPVTRQDFWKLIIHLVTEEDVSVLVSTPYMDEAVRCTYVGFMNAGSLVIEDVPQSLCAQLAGQVYELKGAPLSLLQKVALEVEGVRNAQIFGDRLHLHIHPHRVKTTVRNIRKAIEQGGGLVDDIYTVEPQLEDVFIHLLRDGR